MFETNNPSHIHDCILTFLFYRQKYSPKCQTNELAQGKQLPFLPLALLLKGTDSTLAYRFSSMQHMHKKNRAWTQKTLRLIKGLTAVDISVGYR